MVNWPQGCIITNTFPKMPLENLGILQPWLVPKRKVGSSAGTLALNCIPEYKIHIKIIPFFCAGLFSSRQIFSYRVSISHENAFMVL